MAEQMSTRNNDNGVTNGRLSRRTHRAIRERWLVEGQLIFQTPVHFGNGEAGAFSDMPLLLDEATRRPLLPGTSIAGALRNYLRERERGDGVPFPARPNPEDISQEKAQKELEAQQAQERKLAATLLFGGYRGDDEGGQSPLIIYDSVGQAAGFELRDGVAIDGRTRTAADDKKFDMELLAAGTSFPLRFELLACDPENGTYADHRQRLLQALITTLQGLSAGEIRFGSRKQRGFGEAQVETWRVRHYDLTTTKGLLAWLVNERETAVENAWYQDMPVESNADIAKALNESIAPLADKRQRVQLKATFALAGSLLIRSGFGAGETVPDMVHLHAHRPAEKEAVPVIPGTSWAGALRQRAVKIVKTMTPSPDNEASKAKSLVDALFGPSEIKHGDKAAFASRLSVAESQVFNGRSLVQTRVSIDRFTGGAFESALFEQQPLYGQEDTYVTLTLTVKAPSPKDILACPTAEIGLLLLLLKDLWTGDLRIGGEASVGRGKLRGLTAELTTPDESWQFTAVGENGLEVAGDKKRLQTFVDAFNEALQTKEEEANDAI